MNPILNNMINSVQPGMENMYGFQPMNTTTNFGAAFMQPQNIGFAGYNNIYNPYQYNGIYGGINNPYYNAYNMQLEQQRKMYEGYNPNIESSRLIMQSALDNGVSYLEQLNNESNVYKTISRAVSKSCGLSEDQIKERESFYDIINIGLQSKSMFDPKEDEEFVVDAVLARGDEIIVDSSINKKSDIVKKMQMCAQEAINVMRTEINLENQRIMKILRMNNLFDNSINRKADNMSLYEVLNSFACNWSIRNQDEELIIQRRKNIGKLYNREEFKKLQQRLNNGAVYEGFAERLRGTAQQKQMEQDDIIRGGYGYLPGGIPTTPGREWIGSSIGYNPQDGSINIQCPDFLKQQLAEREIKTADNIRNVVANRTDELRKKFFEACNYVREREISAGKL